MIKKLFIATIAMTSIFSLVVFTPVVKADSSPSTDTTQLFNSCQYYQSQGNTSSTTSQPAFCNDTKKDSFSPLGPSGLIPTIVEIIIWLIAIVSVLMIVIGGFKYVISGGDSNSTKSAKDTVLYAVIGLAVAIFAQVLVMFVLNNL